jgi:TRAP-type mannitol/chloroaromatic compound transport system substrate-binding protein
MRTVLKKAFILSTIAAGLGIAMQAGAQQKPAPAPAAAPAPAPAPAATGGVKNLKMQSTWPASLTLQDNFKMFAERLDKLTGGQIKIEAMACRADRSGLRDPRCHAQEGNRRRHGVAYYWVGKNKTARCSPRRPPGPFGMDHFDFLGWMNEGGGMDLYWEFYRDILKLNVVGWPIGGSSPQAFGWFKRPIKNLADFKGMKCRQTGIVAEIFQKMGMQTVNMPGGEIVPSAQRGVIDCAEWVGGVEDLRLGLPRSGKYHYTPGMHESNSMLELIMNGDVWKGFSPQQQESVRAAVMETFVRWGIRWQKQNADAIEEMRTKHGTQILRTPPEILTEFMKTWDKMAAEEAAKDPFFKKVLESQRVYAAKVVPAKRFMFPPYSFAANHYFPEDVRKGPAKGEAKGK